MSFDSDLMFLIRLAVKAKLNNALKSSTTSLAFQFNCSQQSISRKIRLLKKRKWIKAESNVFGTSIVLTNKGKLLLFKHFSDLNLLFKDFTPNALSGKIITGLGEGAYYVSRPAYLKQFKELLGFKPFFGTLNLKIDEFQLKAFLDGVKPLLVKGFKSEKRSFGSLECFKVKLKEFNYNAVLVLPERTIHRNQVELIARNNLRKKFSLKDNSLLTLIRGD